MATHNHDSRYYTQSGINNKLNGFGIRTPITGQGEINTDWVTTGSAVYRIVNGLCTVDFQLSLKQITIVNTVVVRNLPYAKILVRNRLQAWKDKNLSVPLLITDTTLCCNPCEAGLYVGSFTYSVI